MVEFLPLNGKQDILHIPGGISQFSPVYSLKHVHLATSRAHQQDPPL